MISPDCRRPDRQSLPLMNPQQYFFGHASVRYRYLSTSIATSAEHISGAPPSLLNLGCFIRRKQRCGADIRRSAYAASCPWQPARRWSAHLPEADIIAHRATVSCGPISDIATTCNKRLSRRCSAHDVPESLRGRPQCCDSGNSKSYGDVRLQTLVHCKRRRRAAGRQSPGRDRPARSGAYAASLRDTNSVKSRTRFVLRVSPWVRSHNVPYVCRSVPGTRASEGSESPTKHGSVVMPIPCRTAASCASPSVVLNGIPAVRTLPSPAQSGIPWLLMTIHRTGSGAPAHHAASRSRDM